MNLLRKIKLFFLEKKLKNISYFKSPTDLFEIKFPNGWEELQINKSDVYNFCHREKIEGMLQISVLTNTKVKEINVSSEFEFHKKENPHAILVYINKYKSIHYIDYYKNAKLIDYHWLVYHLNHQIYITLNQNSANSEINLDQNYEYVKNILNTIRFFP